MVPAEYAPMPMMPEGMHPAMAQHMASLHPFFPKSRLPDAPLSEDDVALYMLLVTYSDALDALPLEFTRSFSDLRELDAVLGAHLASLTHRLQNLAAVLEDPNVSRGERLLALKEVADEARAYKMGGEDKIRVAGNTAEMIASHSDYIDSLLRSLTSLPSLAPYARDARPRFKRFGDMGMYPVAEELMPMPGAFAPDASSSRRSRKVAPAAPQATSSRQRERELQEASRNTKKRKTVPPQAVSAGKGRAGIPDAANSHDRTTRPGGVANGLAGKRRAEPAYRGRNGWQDEGESDEGEYDARFARSSRVRGDAQAAWPRGVDGGSYDAAGSDAHGAHGEAARSAARSRPSKSSGGSNRDDADDQRYCFCNNVSYGDMIGCDDDDCEREWFHLGCVGLSKPPQGTWYCDACLERRTQQARNKAKRGARPGRPPAAEVVGGARRVATGRR